ncbi:MAG: Crp/Fnr family transcriptional regulator [Bacteroidales bacterium]|nr:Crp/Fnr family transcriptional regulator [Bacteroidales bacterium]
MADKEQISYKLADIIPNLFTILTEDQKKLVEQTHQIQHFKKNEIVYCEGDIPKSMMCLIKGKIKIFKDGIGGRSQIIRMLKPVEYFAYRAYFANEPYVTAATAFESTTICLIPMEVIDNLIRINNDLAYFFVKELSIDLGIADGRTVSLTQKHIRGRLAEAILFLLENYGMEEDNVTLNIYLSREDLASLSNMTTSNAIRTLSIFASEGIISVDGRRIKILDDERLRRISKHG